MSAGGASTEAPPRPPQETPSGSPVEEKRVIEVPIDPTGATFRERGSISYIYNTPEDPRGVFSFSYYYRHKPSLGNANVQYPEVAKKFYMYLKGMTEYTNLTTTPTFSGWKTIIYTDNATLADISELPSTLEAPAREAAAALFAHPNVILARCEWPEFSQVQSTESIDGSILRVMRHKAMMDFAEGPVFVRDADTYFNEAIYDPGFPPRLEKWERLLLENQIASGKLFLVAGTPSYKRQWHKNIRRTAEGRFEREFHSEGLLAGLVNSLGSIPEWSSGQLWLDSLSFIRGHCSIIIEERRLSNSYQGTYVGKDEQIIIFIWLPVLLDRTFFFYFDFASAAFETGGFIDDWRRTRPALYARLQKEFPMYVEPRSGKLRDYIASSPNYKLFKLSISSIELQGTPPPGPAANGTPPPGPAANGTPPPGPAANGTPPPSNPFAPSAVYTPPAREELLEKYTRGFEKALAEGIVIPEERPLIEEGAEDHTPDLLHPVMVTHAFRHPPYQRIMFLLFEDNVSKYNVYCNPPPTGPQAVASSAAAPPAVSGSSLYEELAAAMKREGGRRRHRKTKKRVLSRRRRAARGTRRH